jgi:hypothetical protein
LYAVHVIDSGIELDRRFATGPELFRTHGMLSKQLAEKDQIVTVDQGFLSEPPPGVFVTMGPPQGDRVAVRKFARSDAILISGAVQLGYRPIAAEGPMTIWAHE